MPDEAATLNCGAHFANTLLSGLTVYLYGDLGAGKTTFVRGVLQGLGFHGKVKSPTYNLVEIYEIKSQQKIHIPFQGNLYHFDLYRFNDENEWDAAGFNEYFNSQTICMIEWPERAKHVLPSADIEVHLAMIAANDTDKPNSRQITFTANSAIGKKCLEEM